MKWKWQFLNSQSLAAGTYFLQQAHTSDISTNSATNWEPTGQIYDPMEDFFIQSTTSTISTFSDLQTLL